jgi:hypothetical protein
MSEPIIYNIHSKQSTTEAELIDIILLFVLLILLVINLYKS